MTPPIDVTKPAKAPPRRELRYLWLGVALGILATMAIGGAVWQLRGSGIPARAFLIKNKLAGGVIETASGLQYKQLVPGKGTARPTDADVALVNYTGTLIDGTVFDQSPQPVPMAVTGVVPGFSEALKLMTKGSKYRFWIRPGLGYGDKTNGPIPANSVLVFDVELIEFLPVAVVRQMQASAARGAVPVK